MRVYIAGPMSGVPQFNVPLFLAAAEALRGQGYEVVLPADIEDPAAIEVMMASEDGAPGTGSLNGETWGDFLAKDVKMIADGTPVYDLERTGVSTGPLGVEPIDGIVFLPGWEKSRGARLEAFVGILCNKQFATYDPDSRLAVSVADGWVKYMMAQPWAKDLALYAPLNR